MSIFMHWLGCFCLILMGCIPVAMVALCIIRNLDRRDQQRRDEVRHAAYVEERRQRYNDRKARELLGIRPADYN